MKLQLKILVKIWFQMFIIQLLYSDDLTLHYVLHSYKCYQLILIIEFVLKMKYLCFDLMFLSKIIQANFGAILLFLDLKSVLQIIIVTFYFL